MNETVATVEAPSVPPMTKADFVSDQNVRWCPGCGDYVILSSVQKVLPTLGIPREKFVFVSGIGCSSRFPYYMNTYGFHTIHGRAPAVATGLKLARPDLSVWIITGDGDGLSIGGNHLLHILRRNLDVNIILFNNRIYGLTKGQTSPTSEQGKKTKTTPRGSLDTPFKALSFAIAAEATFAARVSDVDPNGMQEILTAAANHKGVSFVEIYQNCVIFNDGAYTYFNERSIRADRSLTLEHGKPMIFGQEHDKGIRLKGDSLEVVSLGNGISESDLLVHDETKPNSSIAFMLSRMSYPEFPVPLGIFRNVEKPSLDQLLTEQVNTSIKESGAGNLEKLLSAGNTWEVRENVSVIIEESKMVCHCGYENLDSVHFCQQCGASLRGKRLSEKDPVDIGEQLIDDPIRILNPVEKAASGPNESVASVIRKMQENNIGGVLIKEQDKLVGIFTEGDFFMKIIGNDLNLEELPVSKFMTPSPNCVEMDDSIAVALNYLAIKGFNHVPVEEHGKLIGLTTSVDVLAHIAGLDQ